MNHLQITIPVADVAIQEILVALLGGAGYEGFEQQRDKLWAYIPETAFDAEELEAILSLYELSQYEQQRLEERNWNAEWEKNFDPVVVEDFCAIRAHFHAPISDMEHELVITPKMSFGTGHHATTYMMIQAMRKLDFAGRRVFDFGTGTGVLAILAEKLGAAEIVATDNDDWSIENARENIGTNGCKKIEVVKLDTVPEKPFDIILANINKQVILAQLGRLEQQLQSDGVILLSGLLEADFEDIEREAVRNNIPVSERITKGSWICLKAEKKAK